MPPHITPYLAMVIVGFIVFMGAVAYGRLASVTLNSKDKK
jgi:hypothetical protein